GSMVTKNGTVSVGVQLGLGSEGDDRELDALTRQLRDELLQLDVQSVALMTGGPVPPAAKGLGLAKIGGLVVDFIGGKAVSTVVEAVRAWLARDANRTAKLVVGENVIELTGVSSKQQQQLIEAWVRKVQPPARAGKATGAKPGRK